jgi:hypothetical protein
VNPTVLSATSLAFGKAVVGTTSAPQTVTLYNYQPSTPLSISSVAVPAPYALTPATTCANPGTLAASSSCTIVMTLTPTAVGAVPSSTLTVTTNANSPLTATLSGTGENPSALAPTALVFGSVVVGQTSATRMVTLYNYQSSTPLSISSIAVPAPYALTPATTCANPGTLAASSSCTIVMTLTPTAVGAVPPSTLTVTTNANSPLTATLSGTGIGPVTTLPPATLAFGSVEVGETSAAKGVTLANNLATPLTISSITVPAPYALTPATTCANPGMLAGSSTCTIYITLTPAASGAVPATALSISDSATNSPQMVNLTGTGVVESTLSASTLAFGNVVIDESKTLSVTLTNKQTATALGIISLTLPSGYTLASSTTCANPGTLAAGASCIIGVTLTPSALGAVPAGNLTIDTNAGNSPQYVALTGTGIAPTTLTPASLTLAFGNVVVGVKSPGLKVTLKNNQTTALIIGSLTVPSPYALGPSTTCPGVTSSGTLAAGATCNIFVTLTPTVLGPVPASNLTIATNAASPYDSQTVALTGNGVAPTTLSATLLAFGNVAVGTTSSQTLTLTNNQTVALKINSLAVTAGSPFAINTTTTTCPVTSSSGSVAAGATCAVGVNFTPTTPPTAQSSTLTIKTNATNSPQYVALSGTGVGAGTITLSPSTLTAGQVGAAYSQMITASGGTGPYTYTVSSGALPAGLALSAGGALSGTPTAAGTFYFTVTAKDSNNITGAQAYSLAVAPAPTITLSPSTLTAGQVGVSYSQTITASGGASPYTYTVSSGALPAGLALSTGGALSGTPTAAGTFYFTVTAKDSNNITGAQAYTLAVTAALGATFVSNTGTPLPPQEITVNITKAGTLNSIQLLTMGAVNLDFTMTSGGTCATSTAYTVGQSCTVNVIFAPMFAGSRYGAAVLTDSSGNVLGMTRLIGTGNGPQISYQPDGQTTLGGTFSGPAGVAVDGNGNVFVADHVSNAVYEILAAGGYTTTNTLGGSSTFNQPYGVAVDGAGNVFVADTSNNRVVEILAASGYTMVNTLASGFDNPYGVAVDGSGDVFVADYSDSKVYEIAAVSGVIPPSPAITSLGSGFSSDKGIAVDGNGDLLVADSGNSAVKELLAVSGSVPASPTINSLGSGFVFKTPTGIALDGTGNLFVTDQSDSAVYEVLAAGSYTTVNSLPGSFNSPFAVAEDAPGNLFVSNQGSNQVSKLDYADAPSLTFVTPTTISTTDTTDDPQLATVQNIGNGPLTFTSIVAPTNFQIDSGSTTCSTSTPVAAGASCVVGVDFVPTTTGSPLTGNVVLTDNNLNGSNVTQSIAVSGTAVPVVPPPPTPAPIASLSPALSFPNTTAGATSAALWATLSNTGNASLTGITPTISGANPGDFAISSGANACGSTLAFGLTCNIYVTFSPASATSFSAALVVSDNAASSPQTASLSGTGVPGSAAVTLSTYAITFPATFEGLTSGPMPVILNNNPSVPLNNISASITGADPTDFLPSGGCSSLSPGGSCTFWVTFNPQASGTRTATLNISATGLSALTVSLTGPGNAPVLVSPQLITNFAAPVGTTSAPQTITITNAQPATAVFFSSTSFLLTGDFVQSAATTCPIGGSGLAPGGSCSVYVAFDPSIGGVRDGQLQVSDNAITSPQVINLSGNGTSPITITPSSLSYSAQLIGSTPTFKQITLTNHETENETFTLGVTSTDTPATADYTASSMCATGTIPANSSCAINVAFSPSSAPNPAVITSWAAGSGGVVIFQTPLPGANSFTAGEVIALSGFQVSTFFNGLTPTVLSTGLSATQFEISYSNYSGATDTGVAAQSLPATRTATLTITDSAPGGSPLVAPLTGSATTTPPAAAVSVVSPGAGSSGFVVSVTITGNGWTHFSDSSTISFVETDSTTTACNITVNSVSAITPNSLNASLTLGGDIYGACNITVTSPLSGGGTETASLISAFTIDDPSNAHTITGVTPAFGSQGQTLNVAITASGTHFVQGVTIANFGDGIINSLTITDATDAVANITISNTTPVGYRTLTMQTNGEFAVSVLGPSGNPIFQIGPNNATLVSVSPNAEPQGFTGQITLTATGTHFLQGATQVAIGGVIVGYVDAVNQTTATAQIAVPATAPIGLQNVTVSTGGEIATLYNGFAITGSTPALIAVTPSSGQQGQTLSVVLTGNAYTNFVSGQVSAEFDGNIATGAIVVTPPNQVTIPITIATDANVGSITANLISGPTGNLTLFPFTFTVTPSNASIVSVTPNSVPQGGQVTLTVTGSSSPATIWNQADTTAGFYPAGVPTPSVNLITINSPTSANLNISVPTNTPPGTYGFFMATGGQILSSSINVYANTPTLTMNPANGLLPAPTSAPNSFTVNFTGQFTHWNSKTLAVIAGEGVTLTNFSYITPVSATGVITIIPGVGNGTAFVPTATGSRLVTFTTGGEIDTTYFNVTSTPVGIISVTPYQAPQSVTQNVEIVGLNTHFTQGTTQVLFGPEITVNSITVDSPTDLVVSITTSFGSSPSTPSPAGWQSVYVNTGTEQLITGFLVDAPASPTIVSVFPPSAAQGSTVDVTITGSLTNWINDTSELILGAGVSVSSLQITSPTTATATIAVSPTAPLGGNSVIMITGTEIDSGTAFGVTPSAASIIGVGPAVACLGNFITYCGISGGAGTPYVVGQLKTVTLNIVGLGTHWLQGETSVSFGAGVSVDQLTVSSNTTSQVQITVLSSAPIGFAPLTTSTDGEVVTLQQAIDIEQGSPALLAISPGGAQQSATLNLQILGSFTHFDSTTTAAFNQEFPADITVNSINVIDNETMTANITINPLSYVDFSSPCGHTLTITTVDASEQVSGLPGNFCISQGGEEIINVSPLQGAQGTTLPITITGSATNFVQGETSVSFGDPNFQVGQINVTSPTTLTVPVAITTQATNGFKTVTVQTLGQVASQQYSFSVTPTVATLNEAIPNQAEQGAPLPGSTSPLVVQLLGQYTHFSGLTTATFGNGIVVQSVAYVSPTEVDATITIDPLSYVGGRTVTVTTPNVPCSYQPAVAVTNVTYQGCTPGSPAGYGSEIVTANVFSIIPGPAIIQNVAPATANEGQEQVVNITGAYTHWQQNFTQFYIAGGGYDITINSVIINGSTGATVDLTVSPTATPGARSIYMVTNGESLTDSGAFVVTGGIPVITTLSPNSALQGTNNLEVVITGNAYTQWATGVSMVNFGPNITVVSTQVDDTSHIEAVISVAAGAPVGYRTVVVQTGTQNLTSSFLVTAPAPPPTPYIWYESPSSGIPGQTVNITFYGAYTNWSPGTGPACGQTGTTLTGFNAQVTVNCFQITSPTTAIANVTISPTATASVSDLTFTTGSEVENAQFSVVIAQPTLSIVDPGSGFQGAQNITVNIIGQYTTFDSTTTFTFGSGVTVNGAPTILGPTIATQSISISPEAPLGGRAVVANTPDASALDITVSGAGFSVTPGLAVMSTVYPNTAPQGTTDLSVAVTGQNTHWDGSTTFTFGAGITVTSTTLGSATSATLTINVPALASEGPTYVTAQTGGEIASINNGFVVTAGTPLLLSTGPSSVPQQGAAIFTILSQATQWLSNPPTVSYGPGIIVTNTNVTSNTSVTVDGYALPTANVGYYNLTVTSGNYTLGIQNAVYISPGPATINSVVPAVGGQGQPYSLMITGTNTHWQQGVTQLTFPGVLVTSFTVNSATSITANITVNATATAGQVSVTATTGGEVATGVNLFTITQTQPELLAVVPSSGPQGLTNSPVTLTADFTNFVNGTTTANFGTGITVNTVTVTSLTTAQANITIQPTAALGYQNISVSTGSQVVALPNAFQITTGPAAIVGPLSPASGAQGASYNVLVTGSQTHFAQGVTTASFGGEIQVTSVTVTGLLSATVGITVPNNTPLGAYNVSLTTGGEVATILGGFTVTAGTPQLSVVSPPTGTQGTTLNVNLTGLYTSFVQGVSTANFGAGITVNSLTVNGTNSATANITISPTATISSRNVSVMTGSQTATITGGFSVLAGVPGLVSATPSSAQAGTTANVVIVGEFTTFQQGFSSVSFGDGIITNVVTVNSLTQLTANITIPTNAPVTTTYVSVTTSGQTLSLNNAFSVTAGTPVITVINPNIGTPGNSVTVTITGQYTNWVNGTTTASFGPGVSVGGAADGVSGPVTVNSPTSITASLVIASSATLGPVSVITTTGAEIENVPGGFTIQAATPPSPALISLSPGANAGGMPLNSFITAVFSEPMSRTTITTSTVLLYLTSNQGQGNTLVTGTVNLDPTGRVITFTPSSLLGVNSTYNLQLTTGIQSATGVSFGGLNVDLNTTAAAATTAPTVIAFNPPASSTVGTNVSVQLEFSSDMDQQTQSGFTVSTGGTPVAGTYSWNAPVNCCSWGPGTIVTFTPTSPFTPGTTYTVAWTDAMTDTAGTGNALVPGSFTFTTGSGPDTTTNNPSAYWNGESNVGTNFVPSLTYSKPVNAIDINTGTLFLYDADSSKYIAGTVTVAPNGLSSTFTPSILLLPDTYYRLYQAGGTYDVDGNTLNFLNAYFTTGSGEEQTAPTVTFVSPANNVTAVPLNSQIVVRFSAPINTTNLNVITVTPSGGSAIAGATTLASDDVTLTFVPAVQLQGGITYAVNVSGYTDLAGNIGTLFTSGFTTSATSLQINVSTGFSGAGALITTNGTADGHWTVVPTATTPTPPDTVFSASGTSQPLYVVGTGDTGFYSGWPVNGPNSDWININPESVAGNTFGVYSTTFTISGSVPSNLCLVGAIGVDDNGELGINGVSIMSNVGAITSLTPLNIPVSSFLTTGTNTLSLAWGTTDNSYEAFRLQGVIETCGASVTGGLALTSSTPSNGSTGVSTGTTITMNFNNPIDPGTVNATTLPVMVGYNSNQEIAGSYAVTGNQIVFTPDSPFPTSTLIYVGTCNGPLDLAGDSAGGCYTQLLSFTTGSTATPDSTPFQVMAFSPASGATNVGLNSTVAATFNRSVQPGTINSNDFALFSGDSQTPWCTSASRSQDNSTIFFNCSTLLSSSTFTAILNSGILDWTGDPLVNFSSQFTTRPADSSTNGSVITTRPASGTSGINPNEPLTIYTNLPISPGSASGGIQVAQNNVSVSPTSVQVLDGGYTLEFTPNSPWLPGALVQWWTTGTLYDATYNTPINATSGYFYVAASTATLVPTVQTTSPPAYTNPVPTNSIFDVQFNTPINPSTIDVSGTYNIYLHDATTDLNVPVTYTQPQPNEILMTPTGPLPVNHYIYVYITAGLQSTTSVPATATNWYEYTGTTTDATLPSVVSAVPYSGATGVGVNATPSVIFSKPVDPVSVNSTTFQLLNGSTPLAGNYTFNTTDTRVYFVPLAPLPAGAILKININGVTDRVGNPVTFSSTFTTGPGPDFTAPTVVYTSVTSNESIPTNSSITVQFSESMDVTTFTAGGPSGCGNFYIYDELSGDGLDCIPTTLSWNASQTVAYLVPTNPLAAGREYYFYVSGGTDLAGNTMTGDSFYFYAEFGASSTAPTVINFNPSNEFTGLGTNAIIEAQFSAPIDPNTISGVTLSAGGSTVATSPVLSAGNTILQLVPAVQLSANTFYTMAIIGVADPAGYPVAPVNNYFTTGPTFDTISPSATTSDPPGGATVGTNVTLKFVFNKPLNPITVNNSTFRMYLSDTAQFIPLSVTESASGLEVTMVPQLPLLPNTYYYFQACCGFQDQDGNTGNQINVYFYTNGGAAKSGPTVTVTPPNAITGVPLNAQVTATLNVPMDPTSWSQTSIQLLAGTTPVAGTVSFTNSQTLTFVPAANLSASTAYTVKVGNFTDANGNAVGPVTTGFTTATAAATGGLTVTSVSPGNGSPNNSNTATITLVFSQILDPNTVNSSTLKVMNGWNSNQGIAGTYMVSGNTVTFNPTNPYPAGATIYVGECGGPTDVLGDVFQNGGCYGDQIVSFTVSTGVEAPIPLQVIGVTPASGATNVGRDQPVAVTFNNSISYTSAGSYAAQLYAGQTLQDAGSFTLSADNRTLTFNVGALSDATNYTIEIPAGGISDMSGNKLANTYTSTFSTEADPATGNGSVTSTAPGAGATGVPTNSLLTLYLDRQANPSTVAGSITVAVNGQVYPGSVQADASGYQLQYTPTTAFPNGADVQWFFSGASDLNGDAFNSDSSYFYTVAAVNPATAQPTIVAVSPECCGTSGLPTNTEIDIQYSQPLNASTVTTTNFYQNTGPAIPYTATLVSPTVVRIKPSSPYAASMQYGFCSNGSVQGTNGVAAPAACWLTYFTTGTGTDTTPGTVTVGPPNGSPSVGTNAYIRLQFSKPADRTTVNSTNVQVTAGVNPIPGSFTYNYSSTSLVGANFYPLNPLPQSAAIQVAVSNILDYAGNEFSQPTINFTTAPQPDYTTPTATLDFAYGATGIATNASFTCLYSEAMDPSSVNPSNTYVYSYVTSASIPVVYSWATDLMSVTMTPTSPLYANAQYYYYCGGAIDLTGNGMNAIDALFYTGNGPVTTGPTMVQANPPSGMTNVPVNTGEGPWNNSSLNLLFNEAVATESLSNITLTPQSGSPIPITVTAEDGNFMASVILPYALSPNTTYTYNVAGVTDLNGNPASGTLTSSFSTGSSFDFTGAGVTSTVPPSSATPLAGVPTSVSITFSEALDPVLINNNVIYLRLHNTGAIVPTTIAFSSSATPAIGTTVTLTPITPLAASTIYDIYYYASPWWFADIAGNAATGNYGVLATFTTGTGTVVNGACGIANGGSFSSVPTNLCSAGTASPVTITGEPGSWTWSCNGEYAGTNASCSATVTGTPACVTQPSSLVALWPGNNNATDYGPNGYNGTLENGVTYGLGEVGDAFSLSGNNQYVLIGQPVPTNLQIQGAITMSAWVYLTALPTSGSFATIMGSEDGYQGIGLYIDNSGNETDVPPGAIDFDIGTGSGYYSVYTTTQVPLNQWVLVTVTASANNPSLVYFNGVQQPTITPSGETPWTSSTTVPYTSTWFAIGQSVATNWPFTGLLNDVAVFNAALTPSQVQAIYTAGSGGVCQ